VTVKSHCVKITESVERDDHLWRPVRAGEGGRRCHRRKERPHYDVSRTRMTLGVLKIFELDYASIWHSILTLAGYDDFNGRSGPDIDGGDDLFLALICSQ